MRPLEISLAVLLGVQFISQHRRRWLEYLPILAALAQIVIEGYRWQMVPLYGLTILTGLISVLRLTPWWVFSGRFKPWVFPIGGIFLLGLALLPPILLPIPTPRAPDGPFPVGTVSWYLVDESRIDPYAPDPQTPRRLVVQAWYPAEADPSGRPAPWMDDAQIIARALADWVELPAFFLDHLIYARSNALEDAQIAASGPFPLLLFSHGWGGFRAQNTSQVQSLASHGYIVVAVEHTYASVVTVFPDGRRAQHNPNTLPEDVSDEVFRTAARTLIDQWNADFDFVLENLVRMNAEAGNRFSGRVDMDRLGLLGHSTGGRAVLQFCTQDPRCRAGLVMDPWLMDEEIEAFRQGPAQPFVFMFSENWRSGPGSDRFQTYAFGIPGSPLVFTIQGTGHYDFTDLPALSPLAAQLGLKGPIPGAHMLDLTISYTQRFFDSQFLGIPAPGLDQPDPSFPEVVFTNLE
jgi:dienelactone hydrolase